MPIKRKANTIILLDDLGLSYDIDPPFAHFLDAIFNYWDVVILADPCPI